MKEDVGIVIMNNYNIAVNFDYQNQKSKSKCANFVKTFVEIY